MYFLYSFVVNKKKPRNLFVSESEAINSGTIIRFVPLYKLGKLIRNDLEFKIKTKHKYCMYFED